MIINKLFMILIFSIFIIVLKFFPIGLNNQNIIYDLDKINYQTLLDQHPQLNWNLNGNKLSLKKGNYILKRDLLIPKADEFNIEAGTIISIAKDKSIISHSSTNILGTNREQVVIQALDTKHPFGVFAIIGNNGKKVKINYLKLSGGSEKNINNVKMTGALSIWHMDVEINNTEIYNNHADDGLNIRYGNAVIHNSRFHDNRADQVDLDSVIGVVKNSIFEDTQNHVYSEGLDVGDSKVLIKNNLFSNLKDKGINLGENSEAIIYDNLIIKNKKALFVKEQSKAYILDNQFQNNLLKIYSYDQTKINQGLNYICIQELINNKKQFSTDTEFQIINSCLI